ncbi:hypothetical protein D3C85_1570160 [compost metagenome]
MDQVAVICAFHFQHAGFQHVDAGGAQVFADGGIELRAVQQAFLVDRLAIAIPQHAAGRRCGGAGQGAQQSCLAQAVQHPL